jgi:hypothetical protein
VYSQHGELRDDEQSSLEVDRLLSFLGFVIGIALGWLLWAKVVLPALSGDATPDNPSGQPSDWVYFGSLALCAAVVLVIVAILGELVSIVRRRRQA